MSDRPNVVLVHGAWADGSCWSGVIERLQAAGYTVTAPQFALGAIADDVAKLRLVLARQKGPTVVAGHSYGGQIITSLGCRRAERDRARLRRGVRAGRGRVDRRTARARARRRRRWRTSTWTSAGTRGCRRRTSSGTSQPTWIARRRGSCSRRSSPSRRPRWATSWASPAWKSLPSWFLVAENDEAIPPDAQRLFASRMGATTIEVASSHVAMVSQPDAVVQLIEAAAS